MSKEDMDLEAVKRLVTDLSQKLDEIEGDSQKLQELRAEVQTLEGILNVPRTRHSWIAEGLTSVEAAFQDGATELVADGVKVSAYLSEIGRILGMR